MSEHTGGEWEADGIKITADYTPIAFINSPYVTKKTNEANALVMAAGSKMLEVCEDLAERIGDCPDCDGTGKERHNPDDACRDCGGQGEILVNGTPLISDIRDAIAKAKGKNE